MYIFITSLILTGILARIFSHTFHNIESPNDSKTITAVIRKNTKFDFHHIHIGIILLLLTLIFKSQIPTNIFLILMGGSLSLIADQIVPLTIKRICYFSKLGILSSILLHIITILIHALVF